MDLPTGWIPLSLPRKQQDGTSPCLATEVDAAILKGQASRGQGKLSSLRWRVGSQWPCLVWPTACDQPEANANGNTNDEREHDDPSDWAPASPPFGTLPCVADKNLFCVRVRHGSVCARSCRKSQKPMGHILNVADDAPGPPSSLASPGAVCMMLTEQFCTVVAFLIPDTSTCAGVHLRVIVRASLVPRLLGL